MRSGTSFLMMLVLILEHALCCGHNPCAVQKHSGLT